MDKPLMKKWASALRSGKYLQGHGKLMSLNGSYCCLGVLYELSEGKAPVSCARWKPEAGNQYSVLYNILPNNLTEHFIQLNDDKRLDFKEIAKEVDKLAE